MRMMIHSALTAVPSCYSSLHLSSWSSIRDAARLRTATNSVDETSLCWNLTLQIFSNPNHSSASPQLEGLKLPQLSHPSPAGNEAMLQAAQARCGILRFGFGPCLGHQANVSSRFQEVQVTFTRIGLHFYAYISGCAGSSWLASLRFAGCFLSFLGMGWFRCPRCELAHNPTIDWWGWERAVSVRREVPTVLGRLVLSPTHNMICHQYHRSWSVMLRIDAIASNKILVKDPCPLGLPEMLTAAHISILKFARAGALQLTWEPAA